MVARVLSVLVLAATLVAGAGAATASHGFTNPRAPKLAERVLDASNDGGWRYARADCGFPGGYRARIICTLTIRHGSRRWAADALFVPLGRRRMKYDIGTASGFNFRRVVRCPAAWGCF